ncbi:MAG: OadG family protein [Paludibacteraceae bacterium]|jgi:sodium pump decarboxylase gamma subunit|nr:OadG family protein [Paludibacteraceae bacterium]
MVLLSITADTWIVTGLGFGIVLVLLFCLVYILQLFGWTMQKLAEPRKPKAEKAVEPKASVQSAEPTDEGTKAAIAMALSEAGNDDMAAVAYALFLARHSQHDIPTAMISLHRHRTEWNDKSIGMNNVGF